MRIFGLILLAALFGAPAAFAQEPVAACSRTEPGGERTLCHEAVIAAPVAEVWALLATTEGLSTWLAPSVAIDARPGGIWESSYGGAPLGDPANIRNRIVALEPERLMVIQIANAPPDFPHAETAKQLSTALTFEPIDAAHTRVRVSMLGYGASDAHDVLYRHFDRGNAFTLQALARRIANGPTDWSRP